MRIQVAVDNAQQHIIRPQQPHQLDLPYCEPTIQVLAFWPRICDCMNSRTRV